MYICTADYGAGPHKSPEHNAMVLKHCLLMAGSGDTIYLSGGSYRCAIDLTTNVTIDARPGMTYGPIYAAVRSLLAAPAQEEK